MLRWANSKTVTATFVYREKDEYTRKWRDIYLFDNQLQMMTAIEDYHYTLWLDGNLAIRRTL